MLAQRVPQRSRIAFCHKYLLFLFKLQVSKGDLFPFFLLAELSVCQIDFHFTVLWVFQTCRRRAVSLSRLYAIGETGKQEVKRSCVSS